MGNMIFKSLYYLAKLKTLTTSGWVVYLIDFPFPGEFQPK